MTIILTLTIPHRLCSCLDEREELLVKLKAATSVDLSDYVISTTRASAKQCEPADVISEYIEVVEDMSSKLMQSVQRQEEVLKDILVANDNFIKARKSDPITLQRDKMVRIGVMFVMYYVVYLFDSGYCNATEHLTVLCAHFLFSLFFCGIRSRVWSKALLDSSHCTLSSPQGQHSMPICRSNRNVLCSFCSAIALIVSI
jgi:ALIX V-shaped domain binding to HIV